MNPIKNHIYFVPSKCDFTQIRSMVTFFKKNNKEQSAKSVGGHRV